MNRFYLATCHDCGESPKGTTIPFGTDSQRDDWVDTHVRATGHAVEAENMDQLTPRDMEPPTETYTEIRLSGQPDGDYPYYDHVYRVDDQRANDLRRIWQSIQEGFPAWTDAQFRTREVTVTRTPWTDA